MTPSQPGPQEPLVFDTGFRAGELPDAVAADGLNAGSDAHYGSPTGEQRRLLSGKALAVLGHRSAVRVTGEDRLTWLHSLLSQDMVSLQPGESRRALLLTAQGRVEFDLHAVAAAESVYLLTDRARAAALAAFLERMRFMLRVAVEDLSSSHAVAGFAALDRLPAAVQEALRLDAVVVFEDPWSQDALGGYAYTTPEAREHLTEADASWSEALVANELLGPLLETAQAAGMSLAGALAVDALRIHALKPRLGAEGDEKAIPHELDLLRTSVHLTKGCYKGQETVARVHNLGHPPRRLALVHLDGSSHTLPAPGSPVFLQGAEDGRPIGALTSVALHEEAGPIGLALLKRSADVGAALSVVDDTVYPAHQLPIVAGDAGSVVGRPKDIGRTRELRRPS